MGRQSEKLNTCMNQERYEEMKESVPLGLGKDVGEFLKLGLEVQQQQLKQQDPVGDVKKKMMRKTLDNLDQFFHSMYYFASFI